MDNIVINSVKDKIPSIFVCEMTNTKTLKYGKSGDKYLATSRLNPELLDKINSGVKFIATGKLDGTCCRVENGKIEKRRDIQIGREKPIDWIMTGIDKNTYQNQDHNDNQDQDEDQKKYRDKFHLIGFMPLSRKEDKWHLDCLVGDDHDHVNILTFVANNFPHIEQIKLSDINGCSIEVLGPKFNGNPHKLDKHCIAVHGKLILKDFPMNMDNNKYDNEYNEELLTEIKNWFEKSNQGQVLEGVVLHLNDGSMYKLHKHHLDLKWNYKDTMTIMNTVF